jgi:hypothetical protein
MKKRTLLWLDDCRDPNTYNYIARFSPIGTEVDVVWVKNFDEFENFILQHGLPDAICFDHDLGEGKSGYDAAKWLVNFCLDFQVPPPLYNVQSSNPRGKEDIIAIMNNYLEFYNQNR